MTQRSEPQNNALHLWFRMVSEAMLEKDIDMQALMKAKSVSVPVTESMVKEIIWKPIQGVMIGEKSTTKLEQAEVSKVFDVLNRHFAEHFDGLHVPFPSHDSQLNESLIDGMVSSKGK